MQPTAPSSEIRNAAIRRSTTNLAIVASVVLLILAANVILTLRNTRQLHEDADWVSHTHEVISGLQNVLSLAKDAETGQRGYILTNDAKYLEPYNVAIKAINSQVGDVELLTKDNPTQHSRFPELRKRIADRLQILEESVALMKSTGFDEARQVILSGRGKTEMDALRSEIKQMVDSEETLLRERSEKTANAYRVAISAGLMTGLTALASVVGFLILLRRYLTARARDAFVIAEQAERLRTTLASIGDAVIATDVEGRVTNMNPVAELLTGWVNADAMGELLDNAFRIVNEDTRQTVENPVTHALRDGVIVGLANHTILIAKDGTERPIDDSAAPIRCKEGEIVGCVLVFRDITERKIAETQLRQSEERYRTLIDQIKEHAIFRLDLDGRAVTWNSGVHEVFGYTEAEFVGNKIGPLVFIDEDERSGVLELELEAAAAKGSVSSDRWMKKQDGTRFWAARTTNSVRNSEGRLTGYSMVMRDRTELKIMEDELRQLAADLSEADRRKDEFLATLAHELRNPLAPVRNAVQLLRVKGPDVPEVRWGREVIERQVGHLTRLIDDLLDISRITRNKLELRKQRVELSEVIQGAVETSRPVIEQCGHELTVSLPSQPVYLNADLVRLAQVFMNLLTNAAKYTEEQGHIWLTAEQQNGEVVVSVKDTGVGIPADKLPHLFEMFFQVDRSLERSQGGLGIGLSLVRRLVELHGGKVEARSEGPKTGSEFIVHLPVLVEHANGSDHQREDELSNTTPVSRRIVVVDDHIDSAQSLAMLLRLGGHDVQVANDGLAGFELVERVRPEVVLLDIGMPKLNGYEVGRRIRAQSWGQNMLLIALTGWGQEEDRRMTEAVGFNAHLVKPVDSAVLTKLLSDWKSAVEK